MSKANIIAAFAFAGAAFWLVTPVLIPFGFRVGMLVLPGFWFAAKLGYVLGADPAAFPLCIFAAVPSAANVFESAVVLPRNWTSTQPDRDIIGMRHRDQDFAISLSCFALSLAAIGCNNPHPPSQVVPGGHKPEAISLLGRPLYAGPPGADLAKLETDLAKARAELAADPEIPDKIIWVGRRLGYLWRMNEAVEVFTRGIEKHPDYAPLYRHRGHRYISLRRFDEAIADLERAAELIRDQPDQVEPDGAPNERNIPLTTTNFNVWYHLGVAHFLKGDYQAAVIAFRNANTFGRGYKDNIVATADWMYLAQRRLGREAEAEAILGFIDPEWEMIENKSYHRRLLMYKGVIAPEELLNLESASDLDLATLGFGLGSWYSLQDEREKAEAVFRRVVDGPYWPAFGFVASEVDLTPMPDQ